MTDEELRKSAENATPGPWEKTQEYLTHPSGYDIEVPGGASVASECCGYRGSIGKREDAEFIETFNPETVLALLDRVETAEQALQRVRAIAEAYDQQPEERELCGAVAQGIRAALEGDE